MAHGFMTGFLTLGTFALLSTIIPLLIYLVNGIGFYKIGRIRGVQAPWLVFIPIFNLYTIGLIGDNLKYTNEKINHYFGGVNLALILPLGSLLFNVFTHGAISDLGAMLLFCLQLMVYYLVYEFYDNEHKILYTVLSVIPVVPAILMLYCTRDIKMNNY